MWVVYIVFGVPVLEPIWCTYSTARQQVARSSTRSIISTMPRYYLDTNVFSNLMNPGEPTGANTRRLERLTVVGSIEILGSFELLGEFVPLAQTNPVKHKHLIDFFWKICGHRILKPWNELIRAEIRKGSKLSFREAYLDIVTINQVRDLSYDPESHPEWTQRVQARKEDYAETMKDSSREFAEEVMQRFGETNVRKKVGEISITRERIREWGHSAYIEPDPSRLGLSRDKSTWPDLSVLPCSRAYVSMMLAWCIKCHEAKRKYRGSDFYDSMHYVLASMSDGFVTDDKGLRDGIGMIEWKPLRTFTSEEFETILVSI